MRRRDVVLGLAWLALGRPAGRALGGRGEGRGVMTLFLCGDVMTGRGIDQILAHPGDAVLHESHVKDAVRYVELAERASGPIPRPVAGEYIWGNAIGELRRVRPDARIINLETAVTSSPDAWPGKGIHYRMHPDNVGCLAAAEIDCCALANNHLLDWGHRGLNETLETLEGAGIRAAGAGRDLGAAEAPAVLEIAGKGRVLVFALGSASSGIPGEWGAGEDRPGLALLERLDERAAARIGARIAGVKGEGDVVVVSIHWGGNWGYEVPREQRRFAHALIDGAGVDIVHGHSSHHPRGIEVHRGKLILYGCGDFINDYEGIGGREEFRGELGLMYFVTVDPADGRLSRLTMTPVRRERFRPVRASAEEAGWLAETLTRAGRALGTTVERDGEGTLALRWEGGRP